MSINSRRRLSPRWWRWGGQAAVVLLVGYGILYFGLNLALNLQRLNLPFGFDFLERQAGFSIGETPIAYQPTDVYARALWVGLLNSLKVMGTGLVLTTVVGITVGIARLSNNWLVRQLALVYVEVLRNTPLLLQLLFWYFAVFLALPNFSDRIQWPGPILLSNQGILIPWLLGNPATGIWGICLLLGSISAIFLWKRQVRQQLEQGHPGQLKTWPLGAIALSILVAGIWTQQTPLTLSLPQVTVGKATGGLTLSSEFATLLVGLTLYTAAFIAEIVRAGITAVNQGQREAAQALGLKPGTTMRLVIFPQALRVIVPPLTSQYLNLAKNSSLAIAIGFPDIYAVASTTFNQTGRAVEVLLLLMATYLTISLLISLLMNLYNRSIQLVER
ncbi:MAG: ABC transporter permease subunit [Cyanobacteria bacterium P01_A01_bin.17]